MAIVDMRMIVAGGGFRFLGLFPVVFQRWRTGLHK